jgi:hypothetical protein
MLWMILAVTSRISMIKQRIRRRPAGDGTQVVHSITSMIRGVILRTTDYKERMLCSRTGYFFSGAVPRSRRYGRTATL